MKITGADPDYHRRDLWEAIDCGDFPEWEFGVQVFALAFELARVEFKGIRQKMPGHLLLVDEALHDIVAAALGMEGQAETIVPAVSPRDLPPSPALSMIANDPATLQGRKAGILITDGFDMQLLAQVQAGIIKEKANFAIIAPKIGGATASDRSRTRGSPFFPEDT